MIIHILVIILSTPTLILCKWNYNCEVMNAQVFPIIKQIREYGQASYSLKGAEYEYLKGNQTNYDIKIAQTAKMLNGSVTRMNRMEEFEKFRKEHLARDDLEEFSQTPDETFTEKMKLLEFSKYISIHYLAETFYFLWEETPYYWVSKTYKFYHKTIDLALKYYYVGDNRLLLPKSTINKDYCYDLAQSINNDPNWSSGSAKNAHSLVFRCLDSFPFDAKAANLAYDLTLLMTEFYVFSNFTTDGSGLSYLMSVLRAQELVFDSSLRFHTFLSTVMNTMEDAHVSYKANCFEQFTYVVPFFMKLKMSAGMPMEDVVISKVNSLQLEEWVGFTIFQIDNAELFRKVALLSRSWGKSREDKVRFKLGFSTLFWDSKEQDFKWDRGLMLKRTSIPSRPYIILTLLKPPNYNYYYQIKVDWKIFKNANTHAFSNEQTFWKGNCAAKEFVNKSKYVNNLKRRTPPPPPQQQQQQEENNLIEEKKQLLVPRDEPQKFKTTCEGVTPITVGPGFAFFIMNDDADGEYAVLIIQTFDVANMELWFANMRKGFMLLIEKGIKKLLLDLTGNAGGVLCLAYTLIGVLSPSPTEAFPATKYKYGTRAVPTNSLLSIAKCAEEAGIKASPFSLKSFRNLTGNCEFTNTETWKSESKVINKITAGFPAGYTYFGPLLEDKCNLKYSYLLSDVKPNIDNIILLTDGMCGSSCAIVATYFHQNGFPGIMMNINYEPFRVVYTNPNIYSFAGGQVVNLENVKAVAGRSSCYPMIPKALEDIQISVAYRGLFSSKDHKNPLEFYVMPSNFTFYYTDELSSSMSSRWKLAFSTGMDIIANPANYFRDLSKNTKIKQY